MEEITIIRFLKQTKHQDRIKSSNLMNLVLFDLTLQTKLAVVDS